MHRFVPVLLILALALGACGHKKAPAPSASSSSVTADTLIYNSAHSDIAMDISLIYMTLPQAIHSVMLRFS